MVFIVLSPAAVFRSLFICFLLVHTFNCLMTEFLIHAVLYVTLSVVEGQVSPQLLIKQVWSHALTLKADKSPFKWIYN